MRTGVAGSHSRVPCGGITTLIRWRQRTRSRRRTGIVATNCSPMRRRGVAGALSDHRMRRPRLSGAQGPANGDRPLSAATSVAALSPTSWALRRAISREYARLIKQADHRAIDALILGFDPASSVEFRHRHRLRFGLASPHHRASATTTPSACCLPRRRSP